MSRRTLLVAAAIVGVVVSPRVLQGESLDGHPDDTLSVMDIEQTLSEIGVLLDHLETDNEFSSEMDRLLELHENPLDLNTVSGRMLESLPGVTPSDALKVLRLRERLGGFSSVSQVAQVTPGGKLLLRKLKPFVCVPAVEIENRVASRFRVRLRSRYSRDLQSRAGYTDGRFAGSSLKSYNRLLVSTSNTLQLGVLVEKDPGERFSDSFAAGFVRVAVSPFIPEVILGDYTLDAGQGLVFWRSVGAGKGSAAPGSVRRNAHGVRGYTSADELHFLRGVCVTHAVAMGGQSLSATVLFSKRSLSASEAAGMITGFNEQGLFRTENERRQRNAVDERLVGGRVVLSSVREWECGVSMFRSGYDRDILFDAQAGLVGSDVRVAGIDGQFRTGRWTVFGEMAHSSTSALACIIGAAVSLDERGSLSMAYRGYSPRFVNPHAHAFGDRDGSCNERGLLLGVQLQPDERLNLNGYLDLFVFPWPTTSVPRPIFGRDVYLEAGAACSPTLEVGIRYANTLQERKWGSVDVWGRVINPVTTWWQHKLRLKVRHHASSCIQVDGGLEGIVTGSGPSHVSEQGFVMYQGVRYNTRTFLGEVRMIVFDTDSYGSRLYEYEADLTGVFQNHPLYGRGRRWFALSRWYPLRGVTFSFKYSETVRDDSRTIGSGLTEISGDLDNRFSVQLDLAW